MILSNTEWVKVGTTLFEACGSPAEEAALIAEELVEASLMGLDSHGVMRFLQYVEQCSDGTVTPGAPITILKQTKNTAVVDCGWNYGIIGASFMTALAAEKALENEMAMVVSRRCHHIGRLGTYVQKLAEKGLFAFATANSSRHGHFVVPWGGKEGRLATNPLAYAVPRKPHPVVMDMSTSMIAEGKIRVLMQEGKKIPPGCVQTAEGIITDSPEEFYGPPRGTILPLGGNLGYKGFGLSLLVEIMSSTLSGVKVTADGEKDSYINGLCLFAINPAVFCSMAEFEEAVAGLCQYMETTPPAPGYSEVVMPGEYDFRTRDIRLREGISLADGHWGKIKTEANRLGVDLTVYEHDS